MGERRATTIEEVFEESQTGLQSHGILIQTLHKIYNKTEYPAFWSKFCHYIRFPMIVFKREPAVERVIDFVAKFVPTLNKKVVDEEEGEKEEEEEDSVGDNQLLQDLFEFLLESHSARDKAVRFRCCQLINKLLTNLGEDAQIDDNLYEQLYECMLERLKDRCPVVRYHAVLAMSRLQDPTDENCPVIKAYLFLLNCDPNADVRRAVLVSIAPSTKTLASIVGRTRDVKDTVRKTAYEILGEKIHIKALSIALRLQLFTDGLNDRADIVRQACAGKMLQAWLRTFNGNILSLLKSLDVEDSTDICSKVLSTIFKASTVNDVVTGFNLLNDNLLIAEDDLTSESAVYWQCVCKYLHGMGTDGDEYMEKVLPTCVEFCAFIQRYVDGLKTIDDAEVQLAREFIIEQLLLIASYMDTADSVSRKAFESLLHNMLLADHVSNRLVKSLVQRMCELRGRAEPMVAYFAETVSEIREPISDNAGKDVEMKGADENADQGDDEEQNQQENNLKNDPITLLKCQTIISEMVQHLQVSSVSPTLQMLVESQIVPGIQNEDAEVRNMSMLALGQCCYLNNKDLLLTYIPLFMQASQIDVEMVRVTALKILFDLLLIFGLEAVDISEASSTDSAASDDATDNGDTRDGGSVTTEGSGSSNPAGTASKLVAIICSFLDGESTDLRTYAAEGLAKLLLSGRVVSSKILSRLILLWYNPLSEDDTHLRDCLGTLFPLYALAGRANQEVVEDAFLPTLRTLLNAPHSSPLTEVNINNVAELLVQLTNSTLIRNNSGEISQTFEDQLSFGDNPGHDNLSEKVCNEILSDPESEHVLLWTRILNQMRVSPDNEVVLKDLRVLCYKMVKTVKNRMCLRSLNRFQAYIEDLAKKYVTSDDDLTNIEIEPVVHEQSDAEEDAAETPKRKRVRGLYSQNLTLGMDAESELDLTEDLSMDVDASVLMSRSTSEAPARRHSRKNTLTELTENEVFLVPDVPEESTRTKTTDSPAAEKGNVAENVEDKEASTEKIDECVDTAAADSSDKRSPRSRPAARKSTAQATIETGEKSPAKSSKSPAKSPGKVSKSPVTRKSVSQEKRHRSGDEDESPKRRKTSMSPARASVKSPAKKGSKSPVTGILGRRSSKSVEKPEESAKKRRISSSPVKVPKRKSTDTAAGADKKRQRSIDKSAGNLAKTVEKKTPKSNSTEERKEYAKQNSAKSVEKKSSRTAEKKTVADKTQAKVSSAQSTRTAKGRGGVKSPESNSPANVRRVTRKIVPNTPELKSPRLILNRVSPLSISETPERKGRRSASSGRSASSDSSPEKSAKSVTRSTRATGSRTTTKSRSPKEPVRTRGKTSVAVTPVSTTPRAALTSRRQSEISPDKQASRRSAGRSRTESGRDSVEAAGKVMKNVVNEEEDEPLRRKARPSHRSVTANTSRLTRVQTPVQSESKTPSPRSASRRVQTPVQSESKTPSQRSASRRGVQTPAQSAESKTPSQRSASSRGSTPQSASSKSVNTSQRSTPSIGTRSSATPSSSLRSTTSTRSAATRRSASTAASESSTLSQSSTPSTRSASQSSMASSASPLSSASSPSQRSTKLASTRRSTTTTSGRSPASSASQRSTTSTSSLRSITSAPSGRSTASAASQRLPASKSGTTGSSRLPKPSQSSAAAAKSTTRNAGTSATTVFMKSARLAASSTSSSRAKTSETGKGSGPRQTQADKRPARAAAAQPSAPLKRLARGKPVPRK